MTRKNSNDSFTCPHCGADVPARAKACPECGSDEKTGWSDQTIYDGTNIEDPAEFDYKDWQRREGIGKPPLKKILVGIVAFFLLVAFLFLLLR